MVRWIMAVVAVAVSWTVSARPLTTQQKLEDFHFLTGVINANYGPLEYKMTNKIVDITALNAQFENLIANTATNRDFYYLITQYIASYRDGHFGIQVPSKLKQTVPVVTDLVDGHVLITKIDRAKLTEAQLPFAVGDEIMSVDGQPIQNYLDQVSTFIPEGNPASQRRVASWSVFFRRAARMPVPGSTKVKVEIRRGTSDVIESAELDWTVEGTAVDESATVFPSAPFGTFGGLNSLTGAGQDFDKLFVTERMDFSHPLADREFSCSGDTRISIPTDATVILKEPFVAYYHPTSKGKVGYLRIPHYYPQPGPGENQTEVALRWLAQYEFAVQELEKNTVGLIIDQDHNCGGSVWVVNKMISLFMDKPFQVSQFELLANKESFLDVQRWVEQSPKFTLDTAALTRVLDLVRTTWLNGTSRLTPKTAIDGVEIFQPNGVHYTKPIVMLIDEMAGSGGDMFPSMMQGLGRVKLFGQRTSGLGGHVDEYPAPLPNSQMSFRITKSLFYRPDGVAVENNGATPDQAHVIQRDDILYGFKHYQKAYLDYLNQQLP